MYRQWEKNWLNSNTFSICHDNTVNFGPLAVEIRWRVWGTPVNFNGFRVLAALLHVTLVVGVSQTLRRWTKGDTYIRQGGHHVGHWPTFLVQVCKRLSSILIFPYQILLNPNYGSLCRPISIKRFQRCGGQILPARYFGHWLIRQLVLPNKL